MPKVKTDSDCAHCAGSPRGDAKNNVPGARFWETPAETEERKWISYLMQQRPRILTTTERRVLGMLFALEENSRRTECRVVASSLDLGGRNEVHEIACEALAKICYEGKTKRLRRATLRPRQR